MDAGQMTTPGVATIPVPPFLSVGTLSRSSSYCALKHSVLRRVSASGLHSSSYPFVKGAILVKCPLVAEVVPALQGGYNKYRVDARLSIHPAKKFVGHVLALAKNLLYLLKRHPSPDHLHGDSDDDSVLVQCLEQFDAVYCGRGDD